MVASTPFYHCQEVDSSKTKVGKLQVGLSQLKSSDSKLWVTNQCAQHKPVLYHNINAFHTASVKPQSNKDCAECPKNTDENDDFDAIRIDGLERRDRGFRHYVAQVRVRAYSRMGKKNV
jgi:hypothetical protein